VHKAAASATTVPQFCQTYLGITSNSEYSSWQHARFH